MLSSNKKSSIQKEEQTRRTLLFNDFCEYINSEEWSVPIDSFVEENCIIFQTDGTFDTIKEKKRIFEDFKTLINSMLNAFLENHQLSKDHLMEMMMHQAHKISSENFQYLLAIEDFDVFQAFMVEKNVQLNKATIAQLEAMKLKEAEKWKQIQQAQATGKLSKTPQLQISENEVIDMAIKVSVDEENKRKQQLETEDQRQLRKAIELSEKELEELRRKQRELELEEDEQLRLALLESLRLEEERLRQEQMRLQQQRLQQQQQQQQEQPVQPLKSERSQQEFKIKKEKPFAKVLPINIPPQSQQPQTELQPLHQLASILPQQPQIENKSLGMTTVFEVFQQQTKFEQEAAEERQRRLKAQRDAFHKKENNEPIIQQQPVKVVNQGEHERMSRCQNVLRQAAHDMFDHKKKQDIRNIDYYQKNKEEYKDENDSEDVVFLNHGKQKRSSKNLQQNNQVLNMQWRDDEILDI